MLALLLGLGMPFAAQAWGGKGHHVVAHIAEHHLTAAARARVDALLALEPGATLASISTWADENRTQADAKWHFVNLPGDDCRYSARRDCADGDCVVAAIERQTAIYRSDAPAPERLRALKFIVHLVADVHQPLHAGLYEDRGGNRYQLQAFGRGTNLHALWDVALVQAARPEAAALAARSNPPAELLAFAPATWAGESCRIVHEPGFYPVRALPDEYVERYAPVVNERLRLAGLRLAAILNGR